MLPLRGAPPAAPLPADRDPRRDRALRAWFARHRRPLPWRRDRVPYRIWLAEVLLQQTRVAQALPYFERMTARFPTVDALAKAPLEDVLKAWEGAGYYARARSLHAAAREVVRAHRGELPRTRAALQRLPGFGPYISAAVASLAFGERVPALEANGVRVVARWLDEARDPRGRAVRLRLETALGAALPALDPGAFNEAVMELGETVCLPRNPRCPVCPVAAFCRARQTRPDPSVIPRTRARPPRPHVVAAVVVLESRGRWLVRRRAARGLLGGLWEFPGGKLRAGESLEAAARRELREETGLAAGPLRPVGTVRHAYSHFTVDLHVFRGRPAAPAPARAAGPGRRWLSPSAFALLPRPRATVKVVRLLGAISPAAASRGSGSRRGRTRVGARVPARRPSPPALRGGRAP